MTPDEIAALDARLDNLENMCARHERMLWIIIGVAIGSGALTFSQVVGL